MTHEVHSCLGVVPPHRRLCSACWTGGGSAGGRQAARASLRGGEHRRIHGQLGGQRRFHSVKVGLPFRREGCHPCPLRRDIPEHTIPEGVCSPRDVPHLR